MRPSSLSAETGCSATVLIVEDAPNWLGGYQALLQGTGFTIKIARSYPEAFGLLRSDSFDLVILDFRLGSTVEPDNLDGIFLLLPLMEKRIPVIVVSACVTRQMADVIFRDYPPVFQILDKGAFDGNAFREYVKRAKNIQLPDYESDPSCHEAKWRALEQLTQGILQFSQSPIGETAPLETYGTGNQFEPSLRQPRAVSSPATPVSQPPDLAAMSNAELRRWLNRQFDDPGLDAFILDYFPEIHNRLGRGLRKDEKLTVLLEHCRRQETCRQRLLAALAEQTQL